MTFNNLTKETKLADWILDVERTNPDSFVIVVGDFNRGNLSHELPKYRQLIKCPTREEENTLDPCYTTLKKAHPAVPRAALGHSYHVMVHLIPAYRQKFKLCKPVNVKFSVMLSLCQSFL